MRLVLLLLFLINTQIAFASANRVLDGAQITNGAATITLPTTTATLCGKDETCTLTNKTISGSSNTVSNISDGSLSTSYIKADGTRAFTGDQSMGSHKLTNVTDPSSAQDAATKTYVDTHSATPALNGGSGSAQSVTAGGGVTLSGLVYHNFAWVVGSGGAVTVTATPSISAGSADGQILHVVGTSATNTVTLQDQANLASSGLSLNGNWVGGKDSVLNLHWDATQSLWVEDSRR